jgi:DNA-binding PadR family transcriptional regulator
MALAHAILALLVQEPMSGYDLNKAFEGSVGNFWKATHQQIYRELGKLEAMGWVKAETIPQEGRPDKKLYQITEVGQKNLAQWVAEPCDASPVKEELLVKVFVGTLAPVQNIRQELERHRQIHQARLANYRRIEAESFQTCKDASFAAQLHYLVLRRGIRYETDWIAWCDEALELINNWCC